MHHNYHFGCKVQALIRRPLPKLKYLLEMPRRIPFSNKQKKQQLQEKRTRKKEKGTCPSYAAVISAPPWLSPCVDVPGTDREDLDIDSDLLTDPAQDGQARDLSKLNSQPLDAPSSSASVGAGQGGVATKYNPNRFCLQFEKESNAEIERRKRIAKTVPIASVPEVSV